MRISTQRSRGVWYPPSENLKTLGPQKMILVLFQARKQHYNFVNLSSMQIACARHEATNRLHTIVVGVTMSQSTPLSILLYSSSPKSGQAMA